MSSDTSSQPARGIRQRLYEAVDDRSSDLAAKQRRVLSLCREYLGVESAHIQYRRPDESVDDVVVSVGDAPARIPEGTTLDRATTYCRRTVESSSPVALSNVPQQGWAADPAYEEHGFDCYIGTTIFVDGETYGTVCFVSNASRETEFDAGEKALVELAARLLGREIEASDYEERIAEQVRARERAERKYETLLRQAPDAIFLADAETGELVEVNERAAELTGYEATALRGMSVFALHPDDERERYRTLFEGGIDGHRDRFDDGTPLCVRRRDGSEVPVEMSVRRVEVGGRPLLQGFVRDVSSRREREAELEQKREFLEQTQAAADIGGWEVDLRAETLHWTDEVHRIHGVSPEYEPTVEEAIEFYHPADRETIREAFERLVEAGEPYDLELRIETDDGTRWVHTVGEPVYDDAGGTVAGARGVFRDITDQKRHERDLRVRSQAIEAAPVGITIADADRPDDPIIYANDGFERLTGYPRERVIGENCRFLQGEGTDEATTDEIRAAIEAAEPIRTELLNYRANGTPFWNRLTVAPVTDADGTVTHFVGIQQDVTREKRRQRLIEVLDRVLRHNIRNDVNVIRGNAELIADRTTGEVTALAERIAGTAAGLAALSQQAREFEAAVTDSDQPGHREVQADVRAVVADLRAAHPDTEFRVEVDDATPVVATEQLRVALRELGANAAKHGEPPVTFRIDTTGDGHVAVQVRDEGPGLPELEREVLEAGRETPLAHGSGLGLWMANWLITDLGGDLTVTVDGGTTVTVRLVRAPAAPEGGVRGPTRGGALGSRLE